MSWPQQRISRLILLVLKAVVNSTQYNQGENRKEIQTRMEDRSESKVKQNKTMMFSVKAWVDVPGFQEEFQA